MKSRMSYGRLSRIFILLACCMPLLLNAQSDSSGKSKRQSLLYLRYHVRNNQVPYLEVQTKNKLENAFLPAAKVPVSIYLDTDNSKENLVGRVTTNEKGSGSMVIPPTLAAKWDHHPSHTFFAHTDSSAEFDASSKEAVIALARLKIDTIAGGEKKSVVATVVKNDGGSWVPMPGVDLRLGIKRFGGNLNIGDEDSYTTDSTGKVEAEFLKENLPGDTSGNLELVAFIDDNDEIGTLETSLVVPWGVVREYQSDFGKRSLWATPRRAPLWLLLMAYGCIVTVWSVIIYLITRIRLIRKLGMQTKK
jgi:hypothetical protein